MQRKDKVDIKAIYLATKEQFIGCIVAAIAFTALPLIPRIPIVNPDRLSVDMKDLVMFGITMAVIVAVKFGEHPGATLQRRPGYRKSMFFCGIVMLLLAVLSLMFLQWIMPRLNSELPWISSLVMNFFDLIVENLMYNTLFMIGVFLASEPMIEKLIQRLGSVFDLPKSSRDKL